MIPDKPIKKLLVANRSEIAIRVFRAASELGITTVGVYAEQDQFSLHRFKADESYKIGVGLGPIQAYGAIADILDVAQSSKVDAIHPGYGFLSENPDFAQACTDARIQFIGPTPEIMRRLGNKVTAREEAKNAEVQVLPATGPLPEDTSQLEQLAKEVGYPLMLKASWGGGGRGMRVVESADDLQEAVLLGRRETEAAFGNSEVYLEKLIRKARHVEVQLLGDRYGNIVHLYERDCSIQRRNQKIIERAPALFLSEDQRHRLCESAIKLARAVGYVNAGTAEFLYDDDTGECYFIEVNPRIQVEHTVTEEITGIDIVKAQIRIAQGGLIGDIESSGVPSQSEIKTNGYALQCRVTTENPEENFIPDYGRMTAYRGAAGFGIRLDGGTAYSGAVITRYYDSLLEKVTAWAPTPEESVRRMSRALREFRIRGIATNLEFLENLIEHKTFIDGTYTTRFVDETPELLHIPKRRDRATRLLTYIADVTVNGNPEVAGRPQPGVIGEPPIPEFAHNYQPPGARQILEALGPERFAKWMLEEQRALVTDTTFRDAHQSLLATRFRTYDLIQAAESYARNLPELFSLECWGGATFDVAMRFLKECPWQRLQELRQRVPNILLQMLLRGANGVGYKNYPDNVIREFVFQSAESGIDVFRVFDCLNWVENMRVAMDAVLETGKLLEGAICYSGDILNPERTKYTLDYYVKLARDLADSGIHVLCIKDMAGLLTPGSAKVLVEALKDETGLPIHFHTHDTSGIAAASVIAAVEAGADAIDLAMDSVSGMTSQPNLGSVVRALKGGDYDTGISADAVLEFSVYWENVRRNYAAFESDVRYGVSEVYLHEMPGGQFTNLKEQARSLGLENRWPEVANAYSMVNEMFGDVIKVTPTSKMIGDMALFMVSSELSREDIESPNKEVAFPDSVKSFFSGELGQPPGGFPEHLQKKVLKGQAPITNRPGENLPAAEFGVLREEAEHRVARRITDEEFQSYLMYPAVFTDYMYHRRQFGPVNILPTSVFFYGIKPEQQISVDLAPGKTLVIQCLAIGDTGEDGNVRVFFELNGQPRTIKVPNNKFANMLEKRRKGEQGNPNHVISPMPGMISSVSVGVGQVVEAGDVLLTIEAMKMETAIRVERAAVIDSMLIAVGDNVDAKDLLIELEPES